MFVWITYVSLISNISARHSLTLYCANKVFEIFRRFASIDAWHARDLIVKLDISNGI